MKTIKVQVKWNSSRLTGTAEDESLFGKVNVECDDFETLKKLSYEAMHEHVAYLAENGSNVPDWLANGDYALLFLMDPENLEYDFEDWDKN